MHPTPEHLLDQRVSIHRPQVTIDAAGSAITTWPTYRDNQPARVCPVRGSQGMQAGREATTCRWRLYMGCQVVIRPGDQIHWQGHAMFVQSVVNVHAQDRLLILETEEINEP